MDSPTQKTHRKYRSSGEPGVKGIGLLLRLGARILGPRSNHLLEVEAIAKFDEYFTRIVPVKSAKSDAVVDFGPAVSNIQRGH